MGPERSKKHKKFRKLFLQTAAILMGFRYLSAAIYVSNSPSWSTDMFANALGYVGPALLIAAIAALVVGICFLAVGIVKDCKNK